MKFDGRSGAAALTRTFTLALAGCGGGGGNPGQCFGGAATCGHVQPSPTPPAGNDSALGLFKDTTGSGHVAHAIVLSTGQFWLLSSQGASGNLVGAELGTYSAGNGRIESPDLADFSSLSSDVTRGTLTGTYGAAGSLAGTVAIPRETFTFSTVHDPASTTPPALDTIAGNYGGTAAMPGKSDSATLAVGSNGVLTGSTQSGCDYSGQLQPNAGLKVMNASLTFTGVACPLNLGTGPGVAFVEGTRLYLALFNGGRTSGFAFSGGR